ncbi:hypothetical protein U9M48_023655 [Paspalum notatum var. saurae]|uniref:Uncharacterized protein n=1 Tax=Paspalum notatum var. saurae TaxID=547442 RepID=A0AAQ3TLZ1_PASNO
MLRSPLCSLGLTVPCPRCPPPPRCSLVPRRSRLVVTLPGASHKYQQQQGRRPSPSSIGHPCLSIPLTLKQAAAAAALLPISQVESRCLCDREWQ